MTYDVYTDKMVYEKLDVQTGTIEATRTNNTTKEIKIDGEWKIVYVGNAYISVYETRLIEGGTKG